MQRILRGLLVVAIMTLFVVGVFALLFGWSWFAENAIGWLPKALRLPAVIAVGCLVILLKLVRPRERG